MNVKTIDRYLVKELIVPFLIGTVAVVLMFLANLLIFEFKSISLQHVPLLALAQLLVYKTPEYLNMTLPVGMSLAASLSYSRIARESELTAMRAAGVSIVRTVFPVAAVGLVVGIGNYLLAEKVMPPAEKSFRNVAVKVGVLATIPNFSANAMVKLRNYTMSIGSVTKTSDEAILLNRILMVERPRIDETTLVTAENGEYRNGVWKLHDAVFWSFKGKHDLVEARPRSDVIINEKIVLQDLFLPPAPEEQTAAELLNEIANQRKLGVNTAEYEVAYHVRYSLPASCLVFAIVAPIFAILFSRSGGFVGVLLSIVLVFLYYNAFIIATQILGRIGAVPPLVAAWLPNVLFVIMGAIGLRRLE